MNSLRTLIIDDEWLVRSELKMMLAEHPELALVGEAANVAQAIPLVHATAPEVIFLDVQMPGASGFDLLDQIDVSAKII
ncbi:response regulator, partial [candidate division KSB1 bacterium]|nr:response regulator [candidate division KSB1 bacterium]